MDPYYCIISTRDEVVADLCVLDASNDEAALLRAGEVADGWARLHRVEIYQCERRVAVLEYALHAEDLRQAA
jgi:hypothetical protein